MCTSADSVDAAGTCTQVAPVLSAAHSAAEGVMSNGWCIDQHWATSTASRPHRFATASAVHSLACVTRTTWNVCTTGNHASSAATADVGGVGAGDTPDM